MSEFFALAEGFELLLHHLADFFVGSERETID